MSNSNDEANTDSLVGRRPEESWIEAGSRIARKEVRQIGWAMGISMVVVAVLMFMGIVILGDMRTNALIKKHKNDKPPKAIIVQPGHMMP